MQANQAVKFRPDIGGEWKTGTYLGETAEDFVTIQPEYGDPILAFKHNVRRFDRLPDAALSKFVLENIDALAEMVQNAVKTLLAADLKVQKQGEELLLLDGTISVIATIMEIQGIGSFKEVPGWNITLWVPYPDTRTEPGGASDSEVGTVRSNHEAAVLAVDTAYKVLSENYWVNEGEKAMAEEWDQLKM